MAKYMEKHKKKQTYNTQNKNYRVSYRKMMFFHLFHKKKNQKYHKDITYKNCIDTFFTTNIIR